MARTQTKPRAVPKLRQRRLADSGRFLNTKALQLLERRYQIWKLRKQGYPVNEIAAIVGIAEETVRQDIVVVAKRMVEELGESVEESRQLQITRLDAMLKKFQDLAEAGSIAAAATVLSIEARRSKLLALDLPEQKKLDVTGIREYIGIDLSEV